MLHLDRRFELLWRPPEWPDENVQWHRIRSDGGCLFLAVAIGLKPPVGESFDEGDIRAVAVKYMRDRRDVFVRLWDGLDWTGARIRGQTFDDYCERMADPRAFGGALEITA